MKTFLRDFSIEGNALVDGDSHLGEVINNRQDKFTNTKVYQKTREEVRVSLMKISDSFSDPGFLEKVEDIFFIMECICFSAAYRDGISDLMTTLTFNEIGLTKVECIDTSSMKSA